MKERLKRSNKRHRSILPSDANLAHSRAHSKRLRARSAMQYRVRHVPRSDQHVFIVFWIESNDNNVQYIIGWSVVWRGVALLSLRIHTIDDAQNSSVHVRASVALSLSFNMCSLQATVTC
jgi:hypothetical protein